MSGNAALTVTPIYGIFSEYICYYLFIEMIDNEGLSPLGVCRLWGINKYAQESACD